VGQLRILGGAVQAALRDGMVDVAAALAYYFLFALFPLVVFLATLLNLARMSGFIGGIIAALGRSLPAGAAQLVREQLTAVLATRHVGLFSLGLVLTIYSASMGFSGVISGLNRAYEISETRSYLHVTGLALLMTLTSGVLMALGLFSLALSEHVLLVLAGKARLSPVLTVTWPVLRWTAVAGFFIVAIMLLYRWAPNLPRERRPLWPGALFAFAVWIVISALLASYVAHLGDYPALYGSLGAVIALMLWFYFLAFALLLGAELDSQLAKSRAARDRSSGPARPPRAA
jgi:membrane protein